MEKDIIIPNELKNAVLERVKPKNAEREKLLAVQEELVDQVNEAARKLNVKEVLVKMVGSAARGTWLSGTHDIDVFISFPEETTREELEVKGLGIAREVAKDSERIEDRHAEHPYLNIVYKGFDVDLVPCFRVASAAMLKSAVDRTPFHNEFVKEHIKGREDDVLLLKQFMRGGGVYGSELRTQGFSGYLTELLIIRYGSFEKTVRAASTWKPGELIDLNAHSELDHPEPLIMVDPTDPRRNVAAALSLDKFCMFIDHCRTFCRTPDFNAFFPPAPEPLNDAEILARIEARKSSLLAVVFKTPDVVEDVLYPQLYKMEQAASTLLKEFDFSLVKYGVWSGENRTVLMLELDSKTLPNVKKHVGPPVWVSAHADKFRAKYEQKKGVFSAYIENGRYVVEIQRKYPEASSLLKEKLQDSALGKHVQKSVKKECDILENGEILRLDENGFRVFLREWL